jgi:hypothetical protein
MPIVAPRQVLPQLQHNAPASAPTNERDTDSRSNGGHQ